MADSRRAATQHASPPWFLGVEAPPSRPVLTPDLIVRAAHDLVHEGGIEALSLRALARNLGVGTTAIYRHIRKKEHLLLAIADLVLSEVDLPAPVRAPSEWRDRLRELSLAVRRVLLAHPHIHPILDSYITVTPGSTRLAEACLDILAAAGFQGCDLADAYNSWAGYVIGFSVVEMTPQRASAEQEEFGRWVRRYLEGLDGDRFPRVVEALPHLENRAFSLRWDVAPLGQDGKSFEWGLDALLDGLEARRPRRRGVRKPASRG